MAIFDIPRALWSLGRKVEDLLALQTKTREALEVVDKRLRILEDRMTQLEARGELAYYRGPIGGKHRVYGCDGGGHLRYRNTAYPRRNED